MILFFYDQSPLNCIFISLIFLLNLFPLKCELFDAGGKLSQLEIAFKSVESYGGSVITAHNSKIIVAVSWSENKDKFVVPAPKFRRIHDTIGFCASGISSDVNLIVDKLFALSCQHSDDFGTDISPSRLAKNVAAILHEETLTGTRPLAGKKW